MSQSPTLPSNSLSLLVLANILNEINADPDWPSNERADDDGAVDILYGMLAVGTVVSIAMIIAVCISLCCREAAPESPEDPDPESEYEEGKLLTVPPSQRYGAINR